MKKSELKEFLDEKVVLYNNPKFIESDPIQIPHTFTKKEDIEIAAFLTATISWGNRTMIIKNAFKITSNKTKDYFHNKKLLLVDDVCTTSSTLEECAKEISKLCPKEIWSLVLARGK